MKPHLRWIWRFWRPRVKILPVLAILTVLSTAVTLSYPLVFKYVLDALRDAVEGRAGDVAGRITDLVVILLIVGAGRSLRNLYPMLRARVNCLIEMAVRQYYFDRILEKGHRFFLKFRTGDTVTRLTDDISGWPKIAWFMCSGIFRALESSATLLICVGAMLFLDWRLGLVVLAPLPVNMLLFYMVQVRLGRRALRNQRAISKTNDLLESCYSGIRILKAYRGEKRQARRLRELLEDRVEVEMSLVRMWAFLEGLFFALTNLGRILTLAVGSYWVLDGSLSIGSLYAIWVYVDQLWRPMMDIPQLFTSGKQAFVCMDRLMELEDFEEGRVDGEGGTEPVTAIDRIGLDQVSFRYDGEKPAETVSNLSFDLVRGRKTAVVGPVGAGKSTLVGLVCGELRPDGGRVKVNGSDLAEIRLADYRRLTGYIPQEALLFSDTVRENVAFGRETSDEEIRAVLRIAQLDEEIAAFPRGLDELLGQRGVRVSGGQRQRLAIARALAGKPELLVMDDVTAALDAENEEALWDALEDRHPDLTALIVTHRMATARRADEILVMDRGRIIDRGTHEQLLARCALFRRLARE
jgi:ABC-type multidrug transport system fused ATPase/permease subunit